MTSDPTRGSQGVTAGSTLLAAIVACGLIGYGLGALIGAPGLLAAAGVCVGIPLGTAAVYVRFRDR